MKEAIIFIPSKYTLAGLKIIIAILVDLMNKHPPSEIIESELAVRQIECCQKLKIEGLCSINKRAHQMIWEQQNMPRETSFREMFGMSLVYHTNIIKYVDLFEDEEYTKVITLCAYGDNLESIPRKPPLTESVLFLPCHNVSQCAINTAHGTVCSNKVIERSQSAKQTPLIPHFCFSWNIAHGRDQRSCRISTQN